MTRTRDQTQRNRWAGNDDNDDDNDDDYLVESTANRRVLGSVRTHPMSVAASPPPPSDPLAALLHAVAGGDQDAFAQLYDAISPLVYGIVLRVVRDPSQSEEVAQEVLVEVWRTAPRFDPDRGSVRGWVATIAHRRAVDLVRSAQASRDRTERYGRTAAAVTPFDSVADEVEIASEQEAVVAALDTLTATQRQSIELAYYEGLTYREVAERLDAPLGTVKTRMRDGLLRLRRAMEIDDG